MIPKKLMIVIALGLTLATSVCWAGPLFQEVLSNLKAHADVAQVRARKVAQLSDCIQLLAVDIENLSDTIKAKQQKPKLRILENKIDLFQERINELEQMTDALRNLAGKMQKESNRVRGKR